MIGRMFTITQQDIDAAPKEGGGRGVCQECILAQMFKREFPGEVVEVGFTFATVGHDKWRWAYQSEASRVTRLGRHQWAEVQPFSFHATKDVR